MATVADQWRRSWRRQAWSIPAALRARRHQAPIRSGFTGSSVSESIHGPRCWRSSIRASMASTVAASRTTTRRLAVLVGASVRVGAIGSPRWPWRSVSMALSIVSRSPTRSLHRRAASSARRAPATAAMRSARTAAGSNPPAASRTRRTSSAEIDARGSRLAWVRRAVAAGLVLSQPQRTAWVKAARRTVWRFLMAVSPTPDRRIRVCHRSMSATVTREIGTLASGSARMAAARPGLSRRVDAAQVASFCSTHWARSSATVALAARVTGRTVSSAATRRASRFVPRTVRLTCVGRPPASADVSELANMQARDGARDHQLLDLLGALEEVVDLGVAVPALDGEVADVAVAAEDLDGPLGDPDRGAAGLELAHRAFGVLVAVAVAGQPQGPVAEQAGGVDLGGHVGQHEGDGLVLDDRPAELGALPGVVEGELVGGPGDAHGLDADDRTAGLEGAHGRLGRRLAALPGPGQAGLELLLAAEEAVGRDADVVEDHLGRVAGPDPHLLLLLAHGQAGCAGGHDEGGLTPGAERRVDGGHHHMDAGDPAVGDEALRAVEHPIRPVLLGPGPQR